VLGARVSIGRMQYAREGEEEVVAVEGRKRTGRKRRLGGCAWGQKMDPFSSSKYIIKHFFSSIKKQKRMHYVFERWLAFAQQPLFQP
jgi:hypothetical protein